MVLAAGLGTRMRPLTNDRPKALVQVGGKALIDHMLDRLAVAGVERVVVNVHAFADALEAHLRLRTDLDIVISDERARLMETGGGVKQARALLGDAPILLANIDSVWEEPDGSAIARLCAAPLPDGAARLMLADMTACLGFDGAGDFFMDDAARLRFRDDAPTAPWAYMGVQLIDPAIVDAEPLAPFSFTRVWRRLQHEGALHGAPLGGFWMHVGDPEARALAEARLGIARS
ncbi:MAG: NTP transferase domain-containing protein [Alphaproteobacteria bacterium]|nr:NTP transferase domain-containing protein [Alphaproteobacteria bacterium]